MNPLYRSFMSERVFLLCFLQLSKTIGIMLLPTNFLIGAGFVGVCCWQTRFASLGRKLMVASIAAACDLRSLAARQLAALSAGAALSALGRRARRARRHRGARRLDRSGSVGGARRPVVRSAADRIIAAAALARRYPNARIVFSGGSSNLISNDAKEADYAIAAVREPRRCQEPAEIDRRSRNTLENAEFSREIAAPKPGERWLLITSAFHMPRSVGIFRKAGFAVEPYPVDWRVGRGADLVSLRNFAGEGLGSVDTGVREWLGLVAYWITGKTSEFFPGPDGRGG